MDWGRSKKLGHWSFRHRDFGSGGGRSPLLPPLMAVKSCGVSHSSSLIDKKSILEELEDCPQVIGCFGDNFSFENDEKLYNVLLEYAAGGSLVDKLKNSDGRDPPECEVRRSSIRQYGT